MLWLHTSNTSSILEPHKEKENIHAMSRLSPMRMHVQTVRGEGDTEQERTGARAKPLLLAALGRVGRLGRRAARSRPVLIIVVILVLIVFVLKAIQLIELLVV